MDNILLQKIIYAFIILVVSLLSGLFPMLSNAKSLAAKKSKHHDCSAGHSHVHHGHSHSHSGCHSDVPVGKEFVIGEALASGIFLGAGLIHMLSDAAHDFSELGYHYPFAFLLAGIIFLTLLLFEHIGREVNEHSGSNNMVFALLTVIMLSIHSLLEGIALGSRLDLSLVIAIFIAIMAHKWADSYSLTVQLRKNNISNKVSWLLFLIFVMMTPAGVLVGHLINTDLHHGNILAPIFTSLAAGTFLYIGTLHGLNKAIMVERCCNLRDYIYVIIGFSIMAVVGIWT